MVSLSQGIGGVSQKKVTSSERGCWSVYIPQWYVL